MHIINAMFSTGSGGIEQSFVDYCSALNQFSHKTTSFTQPHANINSHIPKSTQQYHVKNLGQWDFFAKSTIKKQLKNHSVDIIIAHGNRAIELMKPSAKTYNIPLIGVAHNYSLKHLIQCDAIFAITQDVKNALLDKGILAENCFHIPNMINSSPSSAQLRKTYSTPIQLAAMGRFVKKKGFHILLEALALLKKQNIPFHAILGGDGEEKENLLALQKTLNLEHEVSFIGWIEDKTSFFNNADIFCLPSLHEPFGIVLLEAFAHAVPVVTSKTEGPSEIATHEEHCIFAEVHSADALAHALKSLIAQPKLAYSITQNAQRLLASEYSTDIVGKKIDQALHTVKAQYE